MKSIVVDSSVVVKWLNKKDEKNLPHTKEWKQFQRKWVRASIIRARMKNTPPSKKDT